jgi:hypothetical protein
MHHEWYPTNVEDSNPEWLKQHSYIHYMNVKLSLIHNDSKMYNSVKIWSGLGGG